MFKRMQDVDVAGSRVLVRVDLNVPLDGSRVTDDFRIRASLPTIAALREAGAIVALASHLGRPKDRDPGLSTAPVGEVIQDLGGFGVQHVPAVVGSVVQDAVNAASPGDVLLLENTRYEPGETKNDAALSAELAEPFDLFVLDAFGTAHRAHASTVGVTEHLPSVAGPVLEREVAALTRLLEDPPRPFTVVLGGAKVSDKLGVITSLLPRVDILLVGGGMCFTLLAAEGYEIGGSLVEEDMIRDVRKVLAGPHGARVRLPVDVVEADRFAEDAEYRIVMSSRLDDDWMGLDIGPATTEEFASVIKGSGSVFWNGPMGVFEWEAFRAGTAGVAQSLAGHGGFTVVGGGDSVAAVRMLGIEDEISHVSTGGGASLEFVEGKTLPGLAALERWTNEP